MRLESKLLLEQPGGKTNRASTCAILIGTAMEYMPTFRLGFPDGTSNQYRLHGNQVEFLTSDGTWRVLNDEDVQLHYILHTEVSKWLTRESGNARRTGS